MPGHGNKGASVGLFEDWNSLDHVDYQGRVHDDENGELTSPRQNEEQFCVDCGGLLNGSRVHYCPTEPIGLSGAQLIAVERERQVSKEGWTPEHDDDHAHGEMVDAATAYAGYTPGTLRAALVRWPWHVSEFKPSDDDPLPNLIKAGALIAAEIDRLLRARGQATVLERGGSDV